MRQCVKALPFFISSFKEKYMQLKLANRQKAKIKMGLQGPSGSGKTFSSLLIAFGLEIQSARANLRGSAKCTQGLLSARHRYRFSDFGS